jgi:leucyl aminopeptidase (aminopeptidase T)
VDGVNYHLTLDLRYRTAHASGGLIREAGTVGNLPSGEAYIVPYEGERSGEPSRTAGELPVQFGNEIVLYRLEGNRAVEVLSRGAAADLESAKLRDEPAYGNIAELGLGVLGEWGVTAVGSILLDEKLGLHIAFGRSEHFGGVTSPSSFRSPGNVVHIDRVYVPSSQPRVQVEEVSLTYENGIREAIMLKGKYIV